MTVPLPRKSLFQGGQLLVDKHISISCDAALAPAAHWWLDATQHAFDVRTSADAAVKLVMQISDEPLAPSGYHLTIDDAQVTVLASDLAGGFNAMQTLRQLGGPDAFRQAPLPGAHLSLPIGTIADEPGCAWRGVHLDVSRHFMVPRDVRRFIDLAAMHHLNVVQLHLTDDQGWRFESKRYPELTIVGSHRPTTAVGYSDDTDHIPHGGFYTQDDLREIVAFAKQRGVTVVPEIDLPGHAEAAIAAYPWLGTTKQPATVRTTWGISENVLDPGPNQVAFFCDVLDEVCDIFDSPFIHIGGDEVPLTRWQGNIAIEARAAALNLLGADNKPDVARLHGWFLAQLAEHLRRRGRRAVVWDEALGPDLQKDAVVMSWRGLRPAVKALHAGHDVVLAPEQYLYLNHRASDRPDEPAPVGYLRRTEDVYAFDAGMLAKVPGGSEFETAHGGIDQVASPSNGRVLGIQAEVWSEYLDNSRRVDYVTFPRLAAFSEAAWGSAPKDRDPGSPASTAFMARLTKAHLPRLAAAGVEFRPLGGPLPWQMRPGLMSYGTGDLAAEIEAAGGLL